VTLRTRLLLVLMGIVLVGLLVSDVVTYKSLQSFLVTRLDQQLESTPNQAYRALLECEGQNSGPSSSGTSSCSLSDIPPVPAGTFAQLRENGQSPFSVVFLENVSKSQVPNLPASPPYSTAQSYSIFTVTSPSGLSYHAIAESVGGGPINPGGVLILAVPLSNVDQTLGRLLLVEILVSVSVLAVLGALAWWIVRAGLRPLDKMTETAGAIAAGDLTQRVPQGDANTEVGRLGQALNVMLGEIEVSFAARKASEERLRRFLADASHELRTPLTSIRGYAEMFDRGARDRPEDLAMSMRHIRADADRMSTLVDDLLILARLGRERPLAHELVDLSEVVQPAAAAIALQEPERPINVNASDHVVVVGDTGRLRQVVDNLLVNAVRHTPAGTPIEVELGEQSGSAVVSVLDRGPGIPAEERRRIFEPFFRADPSRSRATGGQGLGLAIVSTIVDAHGGEVGVSPRDGGGSRFWVKLPVAQPTPDVNGQSADGRNVAVGSVPVGGKNDSGGTGPGANGPGINGGIDGSGSSGSGENRVPVVAPSSRNREDGFPQP
jgi:two-component system, OmpR family, sensor kinase